MQPSQLFRHTLHYAQALQAYLGLSQHSLAPGDQLILPTFGFSEHWQVLGPFQIGTREATWGADPLEQYGGFSSLQYDEHARFPSSLPFNATVSWSNVTAKLGDLDENIASADISISYPDVDWPLLQQVYGWAALQIQGWARGEIHVQMEHTAVLVLHATNVFEYWVDDECFFGGDFYGFGRAPAVLHLGAGTHRIDIRLVRDVRAMGGITVSPAIDVKLELRTSSGGLEQGTEVLVADCFEGEAGLLASDFASVVLRNNALQDIWVESVVPQANLQNHCETVLVHQDPVKIAPGQSRPVAFRVACVPGTLPSRSVDVEFSYHTACEKQQKLKIKVSGFPRLVKDRYQPHKITYLHPGGMVSYAILRPPSPAALSRCDASKEKLPILLALHGAGLEADDELVRHALNPLADLCAWVLFPTEVTPWSGDDWHNWGFADVESAVNAIPNWIEHTSWSGPGVDTDSWLISGHSNGGQGVWYVLLHHPDKVVAAMPLSGYSSIQNYVPYELWQPADPSRIAVVQAALSSYRHELLLENARDVPILQQHGSSDDNVPAYHSRLMHQLLSQSGTQSTYHEMEGKPHYWDGVMTTQPLSEFLERHLSPDSDTGRGAQTLRNFTAVSANPGDTGAKNGVDILLLVRPGQLGSVEVTMGASWSYCALFTSNVRLLHIPTYFSQCDTLAIDDALIELSDKSDGIVVERHPDGS